MIIELVKKIQWHDVTRIMSVRKWANFIEVAR